MLDLFIKIFHNYSQKSKTGETLMFMKTKC